MATAAKTNITYGRSVRKWMVTLAVSAPILFLILMLFN